MAIYLHVPEDLKELSMSSMQYEDRRIMSAASMFVEWSKGVCTELKKPYTLYINDKKVLPVTNTIDN